MVLIGQIYNKYQKPQIISFCKKDLKFNFETTVKYAFPISTTEINIIGDKSQIYLRDQVKKWLKTNPSPNEFAHATLPIFKACSILPKNDFDHYKYRECFELGIFLLRNFMPIIINIGQNIIDTNYFWLCKYASKCVQNFGKTYAFPIFSKKIEMQAIHNKARLDFSRRCIIFLRNIDNNLLSLFMRNPDSRIIKTINTLYSVERLIKESITEEQQIEVYRYAGELLYYYQNNHILPTLKSEHSRVVLYLYNAGYFAGTVLTKWFDKSNSEEYRMNNQKLTS